ncbi:hypothetical protein [uncultured Reyranella sp.]|uniref:hypothetical protein n=1 Tax=uncultured Reyranella sp. TaxID=735512 RepID=UPI0025E3DC62|nr:hypothetical protein [uncultured Reyranella sp.]
MTTRELLELFVPHVFTFAGLAVWPVVVWILFFCFRAEIKALINRIKGGKIFGQEFESPPQQTDEVRKALGNDLKGLTKKEPTIGMRAHYSPATAATGPNVPAKPSAFGTGEARIVLPPSTPVQKKVEESIRADARLKDLSPEDQVAALVQAQAAVQMQFAFEKTYRIIFGSQLSALRLADSYPTTGIPLKDVEAIFNSAKAHFPEIHKNRTFEQWTQFLVETGLGQAMPAQSGVPMAGVTELGHEFVVYVAQNQYPDPIG